MNKDKWVCWLSKMQLSKNLGSHLLACQPGEAAQDSRFTSTLQHRSGLNYDWFLAVIGSSLDCSVVVIAFANLRLFFQSEHRTTRLYSASPVLSDHLPSTLRSPLSHLLSAYRCPLPSIILIVTEPALSQDWLSNILFLSLKQHCYSSTSNITVSLTFGM